MRFNTILYDSSKNNVNEFQRNVLNHKNIVFLIEENDSIFGYLQEDPIEQLGYAYWTKKHFIFVKQNDTINLFNINQNYFTSLYKNKKKNGNWFRNK